MTLQEKYRAMLGEAESAFSKRAKELEDYREETARAICEYLVRIFSGRIEQALDLKKIKDGTITEIKKTFILGCTIEGSEFNVSEVNEDKTKLNNFALDITKLKGNLMKKFLELLKRKLKENGIETDIDKDTYSNFQVVVTLSSES